MEPKSKPKYWLPLTTYETSHVWPISHSAIHRAPKVNGEYAPMTFSLDVRPNKPDYNVFINNCADATADLLQHVFGKKVERKTFLPKIFNIQTPKNVQRHSKERLNAIPHIKGDSVFDGEGKYYYSPEEAEYYRNNPHEGNTQYIPMNGKELMRFYDYMIKKNLY